MMNNVITYAKLGWKYVKGICGFRKGEYDLQFVYEPDDNLWYIDMPWPGDRYNLAMVAGADKLLDHLSCNDRRAGFRLHNRVRILVDPSRKERKDLKDAGYFECEKQFSRLLGGATYKVHGLPGFTREIWICPVTLTVLGHYPQYIYIKKVESRE